MKHLFLRFCKNLATFTILLFSIACTSQKLNVFSTYITQETLASYHVGTPDPCLNSPPVGQKLYMSWKLPPCYLEFQPLELKLSIIFHNRQRITETYPITKLKGSYVYSLLNKDFFEREGLFAYKVELIGNDEVLDEWRHLMWVELISFEELDKDLNDDDNDKEDNDDDDKIEIDELANP